MIKATESNIVSSICDYLALKKYLFWRSNNVPVYMPERKSFRSMPKYSLKGIPDIIIIWNGQFVGLEVKVKGGKQSPDQVAFERRCKDEGAEYYVVRSIDDVREVGL